MRMYRIVKRPSRKFRTRSTGGEEQAPPTPSFLCGDLERDVEAFKELLGESPDIVIKEFNFGFEKKARGALLYVDGMTNKQLVDDGILRPLMFDTAYVQQAEDGKDGIDGINRDLIAASDVKQYTEIGALVDDLLSGNTLLLVHGCKQGLSIGDRQFDKRAVDAPATETVVRGPREGFTENLRTNTSLLRRKVKNPRLRFESFKIGKQTQTDIAVAYIEGIAKSNLLVEVRKRLNGIDTDAILESGYIEAYIEDAPNSIFATVGNSERPDVIAGRLMEGRVAILVDGTPFVLTVPMLFSENFINPEDYYVRSYFASYLRLLRYFCYFISVLAPGIYVALTTFHQELIPTQLLFTMAAGLNGVPFPAVVEATIMVITFDILREAGIRLPNPIGAAVSIVGALVMGQASVEAGLVGPFMVIIIAITAITNFVVPALTDSTVLLRYVFLVAGGLLGGFGIFAVLLAVFLHLIGLRSFGVPILSPFAPLSIKDMKDALIRMPFWSMNRRPRLLARPDNRKRQKDGMRPSKPGQED